jgi:FO synthase
MMPHSLLEQPLDDLMSAAAHRRTAAWGRTITYSPKVFLPVTNLCRNRCGYCTFRRSPGEAGEWTMSPDEVVAVLDQGASAGCTEALLCLGDTPETGFPQYQQLLATWGHDSTVDYLYWIGQQALSRGLYPHTNAGILTRPQAKQLAEVNVSLGLMLETVSERLCGPGGPHRRAPDKRPSVRLQMHRDVGELGIPFTSGMLVGIGETWAERVDTLVAIRDLHATYGHIQEVIVQNFRAKPTIPMANAGEPDADVVARCVALARLILPDDVSVQAPPNLNPASLRRLVAAGINDLGGISPVTPDFINPGHPWPHVAQLGQDLHDLGFSLAPRLPVYPSHEDRVHPGLLSREISA